MGVHTRIELVEKYVRAAWILKIRLISARRHLWASEASLIHLEIGCLQLRKVCETIAYFCVIAADIEFEDIPDLRTNYKVGQVFSSLRKNSKLLFPSYARLVVKDKCEQQTSLELDIRQVEEADINRVKQIHDNTGKVMHEFSPYRDFPAAATAPQTLWHDLNAVRADHQWLWNQFWHHANRLKGSLFFIDLGDQTVATRPTIIKVEGFLDEEIIIDFDPDYVADFTGTIEWSAFS